MLGLLAALTLALQLYSSALAQPAIEPNKIQSVSSDPMLPKPASVRTAPTIGQWPYRQQIDIFTLHSDTPLNREVDFNRILGGLRSDVAADLELPANDAPVHVVLFGSLTQYSRYMRHYFPSIAQRRAIFLQDRGPGMLFTYWHDQIATDLRHEATHSILNQAGARLPLWLDEGLAEYYEVAKGERFQQHPYLAAVKQRVVDGLVPVLTQLEKAQSMSDFSDAHYRDSWAWIHFLLHRRPETRQLLIQTIDRYRSRTPQPALSRQLAAISTDWNVEFQEHFSRL
jgi:hypothetical protein